MCGSTLIIRLLHKNENNCIKTKIVQYSIKSGMHYIQSKKRWKTITLQQEV